MKTVPSKVQIVTQEQAAEAGLSSTLQLALAEITDTAREGLLAMSVATGLAVMQAMFEDEIAAIAGPKGKHNPDRSAVRHGSGRGSVVLGGRRVEVSRPRARTLDGHEVPLASYAHFAADDLLSQVVMERMLAGVATRRHARIAEPVGKDLLATATATSSSAVSRRFVRPTKTAFADLLARDLTEHDIKVLMIDGEHLADRCVVVALAITADGTKLPVGLWEGATENTTVVTALLADLVSRGLVARMGCWSCSTARRRCGGGQRGLRGHAAVQRCTLHKRRNVADHLPDKEKAWVDAKLVKAFNHPDPDQGLRNARHLAGLLETATRARQPRCVRPWRRCSPSAGSASTVGSPRP